MFVFCHWEMLVIARANASFALARDGQSVPLHWHRRCVPRLWKPGGIPHLFRAFASLYRHCLMGSSRRQQQQRLAPKSLQNFWSWTPMGWSGSG